MKGEENTFKWAVLSVNCNDNCNTFIIALKPGSVRGCSTCILLTAICVCLRRCQLQVKGRTNWGDTWNKWSVYFCSPCSKSDIAASCHWQNPNALRAKEILKFDLLALTWFKWAFWLAPYRLTALSLLPLCFIFGCLLCLSAVIPHRGFKRARSDLLRYGDSLYPFYVLSAWFDKYEKGIQGKTDKLCVALFSQLQRAKQ